ncbi:hypothetical protein MBM_04122 [Drepanopeziza brunnea f. sp. 'multigermtubi' MB_m1]|uniref:Uncharacterized protein n=2 Tax=Drepanopeziza brunnea f. sp. 'multigermtubi' TaxID=698441 RepID=K1XAM7_MARBU|nr:uncharacterized protein MBM_04122 [Drepanopeziza brunnea f. sp. 'multigermtubi' MB_m1]EKD17753.1 hypothetical protein MBM_04122 [Drepanopeziza brunnea f. sp. 'multigermtubi' MB_m1]
MAPAPAPGAPPPDPIISEVMLTTAPIVSNGPSPTPNMAGAPMAGAPMAGAPMAAGAPPPDPIISEVMLTKSPLVATGVPPAPMMPAAAAAPPMAMPAPAAPPADPIINEMTLRPANIVASPMPMGTGGIPLPAARPTSSMDPAKLAIPAIVATNMPAAAPTPGASGALKPAGIVVNGLPDSLATAGIPLPAANNAPVNPATLTPAAIVGGNSSQPTGSAAAGVGPVGPGSTTNPMVSEAVSATFVQKTYGVAWSLGAAFLSAYLFL